MSCLEKIDTGGVPKAVCVAPVVNLGVPPPSSTAATGDVTEVVALPLDGSYRSLGLSTINVIVR